MKYAKINVPLLVMRFESVGKEVNYSVPKKKLLRSNSLLKSSSPKVTIL
jgi:hypothetical protein